MKEIVLVTGGCRSGKSSYALEWAESKADSGRYFLATCQPYDDEMVERVARHQQDRNESWQTVECPLDLSGALQELAGQAQVVLIDCLTLWVTNLLGQVKTQEDIEAQVARLQEALSQTECSVVLVTNEVGCGIVPENSLARLFRDFVGLVNQRLADSADQVVWMVSGLPVIIKNRGGDSFDER